MQLWWVTNLASKLIHDYLEKARTIEFDEQALDAVFKRLRKDIKSSTITVKELSPLMNLSLDCENISITPYLVIQKLTVNELEKWLNSYVRFPYFPMLNYSSADFTQLDCAIEAT